MALPALLKELLDRSGSVHLARESVERGLCGTWTELNDALPDSGFPTGVVLLSVPFVYGLPAAGATRVALSAVAGAHARDARAHCAWVGPFETLYGPGLVHAKVALDRLLVVRSPKDIFERIAVKVTSSGAFDVVVVDADVALLPVRRADSFVRKLAIASEKSKSTIILFARASCASLPVALRLELRRSDPETIAVTVAKDRRGRSRPLALVRLPS